MNRHRSDPAVTAGQSVAAGPVWRRFWLAAGGVYVLWLLLVMSLDPTEWAAGLVVAVVTALLAVPHLAILDGIKLTPALPWHVLRYLAVFLRALVASNIDMARRVASPSLPIRPGMVEVSTQLQSPLGRLLLANSITLTPGTLSVDVLEDRIQVHWIDITPGKDMIAATHAISQQFEIYLRKFLE